MKEEGERWFTCSADPCDGLVLFSVFEVAVVRVLPCVLIVPRVIFGSPYLLKAQQPQEQRYPFLFSF